MDLVEAAAWLRDATAELDPGPPVAYTYHPLSYAWRPHKAYLERYGGKKKALLVGMNPGPWGMGQNGVPFGERDLVRDWLGIGDETIERPSVMHEKRPVNGWDNTRSEQSGKRLWGYLKEHFGSADRALSDMLIVNHCPLLMFSADGKNITPDKLRKAAREELLSVCDEGLRRSAKAASAELLIGIGAYAGDRCADIAASMGLAADRIPHPSPASPLANIDNGSRWKAEVTRTLAAHGLV
ncbi:MAG: single-stranded DNA-binding protein [Euryarchaeota archaeon]|nr:single-stranded DNA-binding protein [Euryarchaeota archaeon]